MPPEVVDALLRIESQTFVRRVDWLAESGSTNDLALASAAEAECELPRLFWSARQAGGRGRGANAWWSGPGALTFSLLVDEATAGIAAANWPQVSVLTGLAVAETLRRFIPEHEIGLKWPNDVHAAGRKVCGILVEVPPQQPQRLVIGVGINVANSFRTAPAELQAVAIALADIVPKTPTAAEVLLEFLECWPRLAAEFARRELHLPSRWARYCRLEDRRVRVTAGPQVRTGICRGIDGEGALVLETDTGRERVLGGTVRVIDVG